MRLRTLALAVVGAACGPAVPPSAPPAAPPTPAPIAATATPPASAATPSQPAPPADETLEQRAKRLHAEAIVVDTHNDIPTVLYASGIDLANPDKRPVHTDLAKMKAGGITAEFFSIYVDASYWEKPTSLGGGAARHALDLIDVTHRQIERHPDALVLATSAADIRAAKKDGKVAVLMGIEGGHAIENSLSALRSFHRLGVRYMTLTHTNTNDWADSAGFSGPPDARHKGLSSFGEDVVREMQRIGMLVDVSHVSDDTFWGVMRVAKAPVIASHSSARALTDHRRNLADDMLVALAKNGGVAMINFWALLVDAKYAARAGRFFLAHRGELQKLRGKLHDDVFGFREALDRMKASEAEPFARPPLARLVDHIDHVAKVAGVDHVGLGSDFDGVDTLPEGIDGVDGLPKITEELVRRGRSDAEVLKILGGNFMRAFEGAEAYARASKTTLSGDGNARKLEAKDVPPPSKGAHAKGAPGPTPKGTGPKGAR